MADQLVLYNLYMDSVHTYTNVHEQSGCQSLPQSTRMGSNSLIMVDVTLTVNENGLKPFVNGGCQSQREWVQPFVNGGCQSLPQSTRMGSNSLLMVDVKVHHS